MPDAMLELLPDESAAPSSPLLPAFLLKAPIAIEAITGNIFLMIEEETPVSVAACAATFRLTSLLPKIWPSMALPVLVDEELPNRPLLSTYCW